MAVFFFFPCFAFVSLSVSGLSCRFSYAYLLFFFLLLWLSTGISFGLSRDLSVSFRLPRHSSSLSRCILTTVCMYTCVCTSSLWLFSVFSLLLFHTYLSTRIVTTSIRKPEVPRSGQSVVVFLALSLQAGLSGCLSFFSSDRHRRSLSCVSSSYLMRVFLLNFHKQDIQG